MGQALFMGDAHMGVLLMLGAIISAGAMYGFQLNRDRTDFSFPKPVCVSLFAYYVGVMMYTPTSFEPFALVGVYAYTAYTMETVIIGFALTAIATFLWMIVFRVGFVMMIPFSGLLDTSIEQFNRGVRWYYKRYLMS